MLPLSLLEAELSAGESAAASVDSVSRSRSGGGAEVEDALRGLRQARSGWVAWDREGARNGGPLLLERQGTRGRLFRDPRFDRNEARWDDAATTTGGGGAARTGEMHEARGRDAAAAGDGDTAAGTGNGTAGTYGSAQGTVQFLRRNLEDAASWWGRYTFLYLSPLLALGATRPVVPEDLGEVSRFMDCTLAYDGDPATGRVGFAEHWREEMRNYRRFRDEEQQQSQEEEGDAEANTTAADGGRHIMSADEEVDRNVDVSLVRALRRTLGTWAVMWAVLLYLLGQGIMFLPVLALNRLVHALEQHEEGEGGRFNTTEAYLLCVVLLIAPVISSCLSQTHQRLLIRAGAQARNSLMVAVYRKALHIRTPARAGISTGQIVNLLSTDAEQIMRMVNFIAMMMTAPILIVICLVLIYQQVQEATFVGVGLIFVLLPLYKFVTSGIGTLRRLGLEQQDKRVRLMTEVLGAIHVIKLYSWEEAFKQAVTAIREEELKFLTRLAILGSTAFSLILLSVPVIQPILIFLTYTQGMGRSLSASTAFSTIALFGLMRMPFSIAPMAILQLVQAKQSIVRFRRFLMRADIPEYVVRELDSKKADNQGPSERQPQQRDDNDGTDPDIVVRMRGSFGWMSQPDADAAAAAVAAAANEAETEDEANETTADKRDTGEVATTVKSRSTGGAVELTQMTHGDDNDEEAPAPVQVHRSVHTLIGVDMHVRRGELVAVVGPVGSGKSSLLSAMLGEMLRHEQGSMLGGVKQQFDSFVELHGTVGYAPQQPWIIGQSLRENIIMGTPYDDARFWQAVDASALRDDLAILPAGEFTEIGERGINLSGGQRARVGLARAVYLRTDIVLLDDPLSALDTHVGKHVFEECVCEVLKDRTRILVTHQVQFLPRCDRVIVMDDSGHITFNGTYAALQSSMDLDELETHIAASETVDGDLVVEDGVSIETGSRHASSQYGYRSQFTSSTAVTARATHMSTTAKALVPGAGRTRPGQVETKASEDDADSVQLVTAKPTAVRSADLAQQADGDGSQPAGDKDASQKSSGKLVRQEARAEGAVKVGVYKYYLQAGGSWLYLSVILLVLLGRAGEVAASFWLAHWSRVSVRKRAQGDSLSNERNLYFVQIYSALAMMLVVALFVRSFILAFHRVRASRALHNRLLDHVMAATMDFFDTTPRGRVLNYFAADVNRLDHELSPSMSQFMNSILTVLGAFGAIVGATRGTLLILLVPLSLHYYRVQRFFRKTSTELQRLENLSRSPLYADFAQTLGGTAVIRALQDEGRFARKAEALMNAYMVPASLVAHCFLWLATRLDFAGALVACFCGLLAVFMRGTDFMPAGWLGLALAASLELSTFLKHAVRMAAQAEAQMASVERLQTYSTTLPQEDYEPEPLEPDQRPLPDDWPTSTDVEFRNVTYGYRAGPNVLEDLSFNVRQGEGVGICGRTGSGKSSVLSALFRIGPPRAGQILVGGVDIATVPLRRLRRAVSLVPQEPVVFSASFRFNLDPFNDASDDEIWAVLEKVGLADHVRSLPSGLADVVSEGGESLSVGQRQLLCIARVLLRKPRILALDEATAAVDNDTDNHIQTMLRSSLADSTRITIAHRLHTIMDSDRVLVLADGRKVEYDTPETLAAGSGLFSDMIATFAEENEQQKQK